MSDVDSLPSSADPREGPDSLRPTLEEAAVFSHLKQCRSSTLLHEGVNLPQDTDENVWEHFWLS